MLFLGEKTQILHTWKIQVYPLTYQAPFVFFVLRSNPFFCCHVKHPFSGDLQSSAFLAQDEHDGTSCQGLLGHKIQTKSRSRDLFRSLKDRKDPPMEGWKNQYDAGGVLVLKMTPLLRVQ